MARTPSLLDVDLKLLRIFEQVVRHNGFSAAQDALGMTQATISSHMKLLEGRLGVRLCERGRAGFFLTDEGKRVHSAMLDLFGSIEGFQGAVAAARGELSGVVHFGTVDAMHTNPGIDLAGALADFARAAPKVRLEIDIAAPQALAQGLLSGRYHAILCPAQRYPGQLRTTDVFDKEQCLYCGAGHPLFDAPDDAITPEILAAHPFAGRTYMAEEPICGVDFHWAAVTAHMEGTALMLCSGVYLAFLPSTSLSHGLRQRRCGPSLPIASRSTTDSRSCSHGRLGFRRWQSSTNAYASTRGAESERASLHGCGPHPGRPMIAGHRRTRGERAISQVNMTPGQGDPYAPHAEARPAHAWTGARAVRGGQRNRPSAAAEHHRDATPSAEPGSSDRRGAA